MSGLAPQGASQPSQQSGLNQSQNPAEKTDKESSDSQVPAKGKEIDHREQHDVPSQHGEAATGSSLGRGDTGPLKEKDIGESGKAKDTGDLNAEQMAAPGEGEVAEAVRTGGGGGHAGQDSLTENMDAKTEDHKQILHDRGERTGAEMEDEEKEDWTDKKADIGEALSGPGRDTKIVLAAEQNLNTGEQNLRSDSPLNLA